MDSEHEGDVFLFDNGKNRKNGTEKTGEHPKKDQLGERFFLIDREKKTQFEKDEYL